jgi:hypothetical protein
LRRFEKIRSLNVVLDGQTEAPVSAERGWIGEPQPEKEWHTPGWLREKGTGHSHFLSHRQTARLPRQEPWPGLEVSSDSVDDRDTIDGGK